MTVFFVLQAPRNYKRHNSRRSNHCLNCSPLIYTLKTEGSHNRHVISFNHTIPNALPNYFYFEGGISCFSGVCSRAVTAAASGDGERAVGTVGTSDLTHRSRTHRCRHGETGEGRIKHRCVSLSTLTASLAGSWRAEPCLSAPGAG